MTIKQAATNKAHQGADSAADGAKVKRTLVKSKYRTDQRWAFGFKYFREIKYFGLASDQVEKNWLLSLIYRLQSLSGISLASILESHDDNDTLRRHNINWGHKNIPFKREDIDWLDEYFENPEEFPLFQLSVSKAAGRFIGFLDEDNVFQVVLLDPLHNAQPSKYNEYVVRLSQPLGCEVTSIRHKAEAIIRRSKEDGCDCWRSVDDAFSWKKSSAGVAVVISMNNSKLLNDADYLVEQGIASTYADVFEKGIEAALTQSYSTPPAPNATTTSSTSISSDPSGV